MASAAGEERPGCGSRPLILLAALVLLETVFAGPSFSEDGRPDVLPLIRTVGASGGERLYLSAVKVGNLKTDIPLLLDSGSASTSIDCRGLFAAEICKSGTIRQKDIRGSGIRVTGTRIESKFETVIEESQLAYARLAFGSEGVSAETKTEVPFLIRMREKNRKTGAEISTGHKGVLGISPFDSSKQRKDAVSAFRAIDPGKGLRRGILLHAVGSEFQDCADQFENCARKPLLQVGITGEDLKRFRMSKAKRVAARWPFAASDACLIFAKKKVCKLTLVDTGSVKSIIAAESPNTVDELFAGQELMVESAPLGSFRMKPEGARTIVFQPKLPFHVLGIGFFMTRDFLIDYEKLMIGVAAAE